MLDVLYNDIKNSERTEGRKNEITNERKKSHFEVAAPPKKRYFILQQNLLDLKNLFSKSLKSFVIVGLLSEQSLLVAEGA